VAVHWANPVSDIRNAVVDEELIGTWVGCVKILEKGKTEVTPFYLHVGKMDGKRMKVIFQTVESGSTEEDVGIMHTSKLDGRRFMNIKESTSKGELPNRYIIMEYEIKEKDTLLLRPTSSDFVDDAIRNRALLGEGTVVLSESSEIRKFIRNSPREELFPIKWKFDGSEIEFCSFRRLNFKTLSPSIRAQRL
jgi:hypothetical protein